MPARARAIVLLYALLALLVVPVFPHFASPNEFSRWALATGVVEHGSFSVDAVAPLLGPRFEDLSHHGGRLYSNKAPGTALVALPGYLAARPFVGPPAPASMRVSLTAMRLLAATVPALALALLMPWIAVRLGGETSRAALVTGALLLATPLFAYGLLLFSHALVAFCLFAAWAALFLPAPPRAAARNELLAGALLGLAVLSEYPVAVAALVLLLFAASRRSLARVVRVVAGGAPFAVFLLFYDLRCFGGPFELSSAHERFPSFDALATGGLFGIGWPSPDRLGHLLLDPARGLLVFSPLLILVPRALLPAGFILPRDAFRSLVAVPLSLLLLYAGYPNWHGGWTVGGRYLVAAVPFLIFPFFFREGGRLEGFLLGASVGAVGLTTLTFPFAPNELLLPWSSMALPLLSRGLVAPNLLHFVARPLAVAVPFVLLGTAAFCAGGRRRALFIALGAVVWIGGALLFPGVRAPGLEARAARGYVEEVFFERTGALQAALPLPPPAPLKARADSDRELPPTSWPF